MVLIAGAEIQELELDEEGRFQKPQEAQPAASKTESAPALPLINLPEGKPEDDVSNPK
jgi:hypothetical protein